MGLLADAFLYISCDNCGRLRCFEVIPTPSVGERGAFLLSRLAESAVAVGWVVSEENGALCDSCALCRQVLSRY